MSFFDLLEVLFEESSLIEAFGIFCAVTLIYLSLFGRRLKSVFDPLVFVLILSAISSSLLVLMTLHGAISTA